MKIYSKKSVKDRSHRSEIIELLVDITANSYLRKIGSFKDKRCGKSNKIEKSRFAQYSQLCTPRMPTSSTSCG